MRVKTTGSECKKDAYFVRCTIFFDVLNVCKRITCYCKLLQQNYRICSNSITKLLANYDKS